MDVYIVFKHSHQDYPNENTIVCIYLKEDDAEQRVKDEEEAQIKNKPNKKYEFWYEDYEVNSGNLNIFNNDGFIYIS